MTPAAFQFVSLLFTGAAIGASAIILEKLKAMSDTTQNIDAALASMKAASEADRAANAQFRAHVTAKLDELKNTRLTAEQQAIVDSIVAGETQDATDTAAADAALNVAPAPAAPTA